MKILHILYSGLGGHGNVFFSMTDADVDKEFNYEALFFGVEEMRDEYVQKAALRKIPYSFVKKNSGFDFSSYRKIVSIIYSSGADIIFLHSSAYILPVKWAAFFTRKKIKIIIRETQPNHLKTKSEWLGLCIALLTANKVVFLSTEYRDEIKKKLHLLFTSRRTTVIPNGIDLSIFAPTNKKVNEIVTLGMQSRLSVTKDHFTLLNAFSLILQKWGKQKVKLKIAGEGECSKALEKRAQELGITENIEFTGLLEENKLPGFINSLDIYIHASLGETMSTAIMQVMACKLPIIASDVLGINNMIKHDYTGLLVPVKNEKAIAEAVDYLIINPAVALKLSENAFNFATANYSNVSMFASYRQIFNAS